MFLDFLLEYCNKSANNKGKIINIKNDLKNGKISICEKISVFRNSVKYKGNNKICHINSNGETNNMSCSIIFPKALKTRTYSIQGINRTRYNPIKIGASEISNNWIKP